MKSWFDKCFYNNFLSFADIILMAESTKGTPTNIIHGTKEIVNRNVRWYKGMVAKCCPNSQ
jgi:hypothetical protein